MLVYDHNCTEIRTRPKELNRDAKIYPLCTGIIDFFPLCAFCQAAAASFYSIPLIQSLIRGIYRTAAAADMQLHLRLFIGRLFSFWISRYHCSCSSAIDGSVTAAAAAHVVVVVLAGAIQVEQTGTSVIHVPVAIQNPSSHPAIHPSIEPLLPYHRAVAGLLLAVIQADAVKHIHGNQPSVRRLVLQWVDK